jgi:hypothetical protein
MIGVQTLLNLPKMKTRIQNPAETLVEISHRSQAVSSEFLELQNDLHHRLQSAILRAKDQKEVLKPEPKANDFGSAWLPGPLSYPWLLMFAGIPKVIEQILRQV